MRKSWFACLATAAIVLAPGAAHADNRRGPEWVDAQEFATLPAGVRNPEGITANPANGDVFVATFDARDPPAVRNNKLLRYSKSGRLVAQKDFGPTPLLGLGFRGGQVYILNFGASELQRIAANFDAATPVRSVARFPSIGPPPPRTTGNPDGSADVITFGSSGFPAPNAMAFDAAGNLYVSDSFQGAIYKILDAPACATPCPVSVVAHDPSLATAGFPPFGANGLALDAAGTSLFIANTGDNRVLRMTLADGTIAPFAESLHGADGLWFSHGLLWVAANQADTVFALNDKGRYVVRAGEFEGIGNDGAPRGLLFPASLVENDGWMYVTNAALALTPAAGDEWEEDVTRWNIARFRVAR
jgi:DNA-binding beta-propeller fold protein YncE